jgi:hypothetical protein
MEANVRQLRREERGYRQGNHGGWQMRLTQSRRGGIPSRVIPAKARMTPDWHPPPFGKKVDIANASMRAADLPLVRPTGIASTLLPELID